LLLHGAAWGFSIGVQTRSKTQIYATQHKFTLLALHC